MTEFTCAPSAAGNTGEIKNNMPSYNKVILIGNLTRDPEVRFTPKGLAIAKIGLAMNRTWKDANGDKKEEVTFVDVDAFGKQAEAIGQYLKKGRPIMIEGRLKLDVWDDKQTNQKRSKLGVALESFQFMDSKGAENTKPEAKSEAQAPATDVNQDDVPF